MSRKGVGRHPKPRDSVPVEEVGSREHVRSAEDCIRCGDVDSERIPERARCDAGCDAKSSTVVAHSVAVNLRGVGVRCHGEFDVIGWMEEYSRRGSQERFGGIRAAVREDVHVTGGASALET